MPDAIYDVAIIGGGPAGSTAATLLARAGRRVIVCEREKFPRFHIGESLLPVSMKTFTRLGVHEKFEQRRFPQEIRRRNDQRLLRRGSEVLFQGRLSLTNRVVLPGAARASSTRCCSITQPKTAPKCGRKRRSKRCRIFPDRVELQVQAKAAAPEKISRPLCDRRERSTFRPGQSFQLKETYPHLQKISIFAHYEGVELEEGRDGCLPDGARGRPLVLVHSFA